MNTKKEIVDKIYKILGEDQTSTVFDKEGEVVPKMNEIVDKICRCNVTNILTQTKIRGGILDFLYEEKTIRIPETKRLMEDIDENSTSITLDKPDDLPASGYISIEGNIVKYGAINDGVLSQLTGINGYHKAGSTVYFAYQMPSKVLKPADIFDNENQTLLSFVDFRENIGFRRCYTIKPHKGKKIAVFYNIDSPVMISYSKRLDPMETDDDECGLPDDYGIKIIPNLVCGELLIDTSEVQKGERLLSIGYAELEDMYSFYATPTKQFRKKIKVAPMIIGERDDFIPNAQTIG